MRDWLDDGKSGAGDRDPYAVSHLGWGMNPQALWYGIALNGDEPERLAPRRARSRAISCSPPARTRRAAASAPRAGTTTCRCATASIELDGRVVVKDGRIVDEAMRVARVKR